MQSFYRSSEGRYDTVLVSKEKREDRSENCGSSEKISVWLGKGLAFLRVALDAIENTLCPTHKKKCCVKFAYSCVKELCFIQWYEAIISQIRKVYKIDKTLSSSRICLHQNVGGKDSLSPSKEYVLVPVESKRGVVRVVEKNFELSVENRSGCRQNDKVKGGVGDVD